MKIKELLSNLHLYNPELEIVLLHNVGSDKPILSQTNQLQSVQYKHQDGTLQTFLAIIDESTRVKPETKEIDPAETSVNQDE